MSSLAQLVRLGAASLALALLSSGCANTMALRTGRVLPPGEREMVAGAAWQVAATPLGTRSAPNLASRSDEPLELEVPSYPHLPQAMFGVRWGLPYGFELGAGLSLPGFMGAFAMARKSVLDQGRLAVAVGLDANVSFFANDSAGVGGSWLMWGGRVAADVSLHGAAWALYACPGLGLLGSRHGRWDNELHEEASVATAVPLTGVVVGARFGRRIAGYVEFGLHTPLGGSGRVLLAPAAGVAFP